MPINSADTFSSNVLIWKETYFDGLTLSGIQALLTKLDFQVWLSAKQMTNIICSQWCDILQIDESFNYFLTSQNSYYFLPGQTLEISAGLGTYVKNIKPQIFIDGQKQTVTSGGYAIFRKKITGNRNGSTKIIISYIDPFTEETKTMSKEIFYTVLMRR